MLSTLSLIGFGQAIVLILGILIIIKQWSPLKVVSILALTLVGLRLLKTAFSQPDSPIQLSAEFMLMTSFLGLAILPTLYILQRLLANPEQTLSSTLGLHYALPAVTFVISLVAVKKLQTLGGHIPLQSYYAHDILSLSLNELMVMLEGRPPLSPILAMLQTGTYGLLSYRHWSKARKDTLHFSGSRAVAAFILINCLGLTALLFASLVSGDISVNTIVTLATLCSLTLLYGWVVFSLVRLNAWVQRLQAQRATTHAHLEHTVAERSSTQKKYAKSGLSDGRMKVLTQRASQLLNDQQLYKHSELSLSQLATKIGCTSHHLSQAINSQLNRSYAELVTELRLQEAKTLLEREPRMSVLDIAMEAGFNSKSGFYNAFKKDTGLTPSAYRSSLNLTPVS